VKLVLATWWWEYYITLSLNFIFSLSGLWNGNSKNLNVEFSNFLICLVNGRHKFWMISIKFLWWFVMWWIWKFECKVHNFFGCVGPWYRQNWNHFNSTIMSCLWRDKFGHCNVKSVSSLNCVVHGTFKTWNHLINLLLDYDVGTI